MLIPVRSIIIVLFILENSLWDSFLFATVVVGESSMLWKPVHRVSGRMGRL